MTDKITGHAERSSAVDLRSTSSVVEHGRPVVPFVDLKVIHDSLDVEIALAIQSVVDRSDFILGRSVAEFESAFAEFCGVQHGIGVDSGFSALELSLRAYDIGPGEEVITAANTFVATVAAIEACGATPVLVDIDRETFNLDPQLLEEAITPATRAIIPVHLYGRPAAMDQITAIAARHGLIVLEDACQAHGAWYGSSRAGALGHVAAFSFYPAKNLGALGDGGMIVTNDDAIDARLRRLRNLGSVEKYRHDVRGFNRRLDTLHAAVLNAKLPHLDAHNDWRRRAAARYIELLADVPVICPRFADAGEHVFHLFVIEAPQRDALRSHLLDMGFETGIHYPIPIHHQPAYRGLGAVGDYPMTEESANRILSLPMYVGISDDAIERTCDAIASFYGRRA